MGGRTRDGKTRTMSREEMAADAAGKVDVHFRIGIDDFTVRLSKEHATLFVTALLVNGEDIVLRAGYAKHRKEIVLRGSLHLAYTTREADPERFVATYNLFTLQHIRRDHFEKQRRALEAQDKGQAAG